MERAPLQPSPPPSMTMPPHAPPGPRLQTPQTTPVRRPFPSPLSKQSALTPNLTDFHGLEGFCADNVPRTGGSGPSITRTADASPTQTGGGDVVGPPGGGSSSRGGFGGFGGGGSSETGEATPRRTTTVVDTPTGLPNLAPRGLAGGPVAWVAGLLSLVMSLFFLA